MRYLRLRYPYFVRSLANKVIVIDSNTFHVLKSHDNDWWVVIKYGDLSYVCNCPSYNQRNITKFGEPQFLCKHIFSVMIREGANYPIMISSLMGVFDLTFDLTFE